MNVNAKKTVSAALERFLMTDAQLNEKMKPRRCSGNGNAVDQLHAGADQLKVQGRRTTHGLI
jgi:hypothetical protein